MSQLLKPNTKGRNSRYLNGNDTIDKVQTCSMTFRQYYENEGLDYATRDPPYLVIPGYKFDAITDHLRKRNMQDDFLDSYDSEKRNDTLLNKCIPVAQRILDDRNMDNLHIITAKLLEFGWNALTGDEYEELSPNGEKVEVDIIREGEDRRTSLTRRNQYWGYQMGNAMKSFLDRGEKLTVNGWGRDFFRAFSMFGYVKEQLELFEADCVTLLEFSEAEDSEDESQEENMD